MCVGGGGGGGGQKNDFNLGYENFVGIFLGSSHNWTIFRGHFYAFKGLLLRSRYRMGDIFGGLLNFLIFFGVNDRCWARAYV